MNKKGSDKEKTKTKTTCGAWDGIFMFALDTGRYRIASWKTNPKTNNNHTNHEGGSNKRKPYNNDDDADQMTMVVL